MDLIHLFVLISCIFTLPLCRCQPKPLDVEIITTAPYTAPVASSLIWTGAALEYGVAKANAKYNGTLNMTVSILATSRTASCEQSRDAVTGLFAEHYYRRVKSNSCIILFSTNCGGMNEVLRLTKDLDLLTFDTGLGAVSDYSNQQFPNLLSPTGTYTGVANAILFLLRRCKWFRVVVLFDKTAGPTYYSALNNALKEEFRKQPNYTATFLTFDGSQRNTYARTVQDIRAHGRITISLCHTRVLISLLNTIRDLNLVVSEYVFISSIAGQIAAYGPTTMFHSPPIKADVELYRSVIYIVPSAPRNNLRAVDDQLRKLAVSKYNTRFENGTMVFDQFMIRSMYDLIEILSSVLMRNRAKLNNCRGSTLLRYFRNVTFRPETGPAFMDSDGVRNWDLDLLAYDAYREQMITAGFYDSMEDSLVFRQLQVRNALTDPPPDRPACGLRDDSSCGGGQNTVIAIVVAIVCIMAVLSVIAVLVFRRFHGDHSGAVWWLIKEHDVRPDHTISTHDNRAEIVNSKLEEYFAEQIKEPDLWAYGSQEEILQKSEPEETKT